MKRTLSEHNGYSLIELIIVIAIIVILTALSFASMNILNTARVKDACVLTGSKVSELKTKSMNMSYKKGDTIKNYGLSIYVDADNLYHIAEIKVLSDGSIDYTGGEDITFSRSVVVKFTGNKLESTGLQTDYMPGQKGATGDNSPVYILFDKRGNCYSGYGELSFYKKNGIKVSKVKIGSSGNVDTR